jgi:aerobic-type carbon monoxide dehydrogenase small subunit (CoxS/CutS family)
MGRKKGESHREFKARMIDPVSDSFCAAKWYNATIWLGHGGTTSCHHPPAHQIDLEEIKTNPSAIHNTRHKKKMRQMMIDGQRPKECEYCWKIEDMEKDSDGNEPVSDRTFKTVIYRDSDLRKIATADTDNDVNLKTLEIAFNRTCQLACSYCNPAFSSTWVKDIRNNGGYHGIKSDARGHFIDDAPYAEPFDDSSTNPYVDAFWRWWPELSEELEEIRVTGGEPLMTPDIYQLFDWFKETDSPNKEHMRLAINSNLMAKPDLLQKLIDATQHINRFHLYTSCEAIGTQAEYIRDGLEWETWTHNFERICSESRIEGLHMMMTINALCLDTITEFLDWCLDMKRKYGHNRPGISVNILRFPSFQSPLTLPDSLRKMYHDELKTWLDNVREKDEKDANGVTIFQPWEQDQVSRLIEYLDVVKTPHRNTADRQLLEHDFKVFYEQYDARRFKNFKETFPRLAEFYDNIQVMEITKDEDIQAPKSFSLKDGLYAKRVVTEDGEVKVVEMEMRKRKTGESDEWYDNPLDPESRKELMKKIGGSSIGWDTETDGLGGAEDE